MHELLHASLQVSWIWIHRELRLVLHVLPYHDILSTGRSRAADGEQQSAIKADFQESQDFAAGRILGKVAESRKANGEERSIRVRMMGSLYTRCDA